MTTRRSNLKRKKMMKYAEISVVVLLIVALVAVAIVMYPRTKASDYFAFSDVEAEYESSVGSATPTINVQRLNLTVMPIGGDATNFTINPGGNTDPLDYYYSEIKNGTEQTIEVTLNSPVQSIKNGTTYPFTIFVHCDEIEGNVTLQIRSKASDYFIFTDLGAEATTVGSSATGVKQAVSVWIDPETVAVNPADYHMGDRFNVTVWTNTYQNDTDRATFAWQIAINFNGSLLSATRTGYTNGSTSQFFSGHSTVPVSPIITTTSASIGESLIGTDSRAPGNGSLCWIEMQIKMAPTGDATLTGAIAIDGSNTFLLTNESTQIPFTKYDSVYKYGFAPNIKIGKLYIVVIPVEGNATEFHIDPGGNTDPIDFYEPKIDNGTSHSIEATLTNTVQSTRDGNAYPVRIFVYCAEAEGYVTLRIPVESVILY